MFILTAYKDGVVYFTITRNLSKEQLLFLRNTSQFSCPQCGNPLRLKIGKVVTPHFAHIVLTDCLTSFSERESPTHLLGKQQLAEFFTRVGYKVSVEAYLPKISQRPDLLVSNLHQMIAIEFQCSVIPIDDILSRNQGYIKGSIQILWILRTPVNNQMSYKAIRCLKLSKFLQRFISSDAKSGATLITFDPTTALFVYYSHLVHISGTTFIGKTGALPIDQQTFPFAQLKSITAAELKEYWTIFQHNRIKFLRYRRVSSKLGTKDRFLKACYEHQISPEHLPLIIGYPIKGSEIIQDHLVEWQMALINELSKNFVELQCISENWIVNFLASNCKPIHIQKATQVVRHYCRFLMLVNYNVQQSISQQIFSESKLLSFFVNEMVAKRCEY